MIMTVVVLWTKPSGLYRHRRRLGLHRVSYIEGDLTSKLPSLPSTQRRVPSGHGTKSSIMYLHSPTVRPKHIVRLSEDPLIQDSLTQFETPYPRSAGFDTDSRIVRSTEGGPASRARSQKATGCGRSCADTGQG